MNHHRFDSGERKGGGPAGLRKAGADLEVPAEPGAAPVQPDFARPDEPASDADRDGMRETLEQLHDVYAAGASDAVFLRDGADWADGGKEENEPGLAEDPKL